MAGDSRDARRAPAQSERNRALDAEKLANEQTDRALKAEQIARAELERVANQVRRIKEATVYLKNSVAGKTFASGTGFVVDVTGDSVLAGDESALRGTRPRRNAQTPVPESSTPEMEAVFLSGQGPPHEQVLPAKLIAADYVRQSQHRPGVSDRQRCEAATRADQYAQSLGPGGRAWPS